MVCSNGINMSKAHQVFAIYREWGRKIMLFPVPE
jgi:hypothetical protein